jgi:hypothetical protein
MKIARIWISKFQQLIIGIPGFYIEDSHERKFPNFSFSGEDENLSTNFKNCQRH